MKSNLIRLLFITVINLNENYRPQNLTPDTYYKICKEYENLINNTEHEIKNLLEFCNLKWEDSCLKFYDTKRPIKTASDTQVRNKIYNSSINLWKKYEKLLNKYYEKLQV